MLASLVRHIFVHIFVNSKKCLYIFFSLPRLHPFTTHSFTPNLGVIISRYKQFSYLLNKQNIIKAKTKCSFVIYYVMKRRRKGCTHLPHIHLPPIWVFPPQDKNNPHICLINKIKAKT